MPCHHIPLTPAGDTVDSVERWSDQQELEEVVKNWLRTTIRQIEEHQVNGESAPTDPSQSGLAQKLEAANEATKVRDAKEGTEQGAALEQGRKKILVVDDDEHALIVMQAVLENDGYDTTAAWSGCEALDLPRSRPFDLVPLDDQVLDPEASTILRYIERMSVRPLAVVMQRRSTPGALSRFEAFGACDVVDKRMARRDISAAVHNCLRPAPLARARA